MKPSLPAKTRLPCRRRCRSRITSTSLEQYDGAMPHRAVMMVHSSLSGMSPTCSSRNRLRNARLSALRPAYAPGGFCVAKSMKCGWGRMVSCSSGTKSSRLSSSRRLSASRTSVGARLSSSRTTQWPARTARTSAPSWKHSRPLESATYVPRYSARSVCSWLFMRTKRCPVRLARCSTRLVFPLDVGPCSRTGYRRTTTPLARLRRCSRVDGVSTKSGSWPSGAPASPASTQKCSKRTWPAPPAGAAGGRMSSLRSAPRRTCLASRPCTTSALPCWSSVRKDMERPSYSARCSP
mmetsp:Transcript_19684/g.66983  ORF Transcript_19684/g.66983 Transcript_19684/m.66983 type:complete len:294 (+) Transcript_19684:1462-2343(+)